MEDNLKKDEEYMRRALMAAQAAFDEDETSVSDLSDPATGCRLSPIWRAGLTTGVACRQGRTGGSDDAATA